MSSDKIIRVLSLCIALAGTETLHGIARTLLLAPRVGSKLAVKLSIVSGSALAFIVCYFLVPSVGLTTIKEHLALGLGLAVFMASFDVAMGKLLLHRSWRGVLSDFNPTTGNLLIVGLALLVTFPGLVFVLRDGN